jgi:hypothetical protein
MIMDEMTMDQIALAAECITLARVEFIRATIVSPAEQILEQFVGATLTGTEPETESNRAARAAARRAGARPKKSTRTPEERDANIMAVAARWGMTIESA